MVLRGRTKREQVMAIKIAPKGSSDAFLRAHVAHDGDDCLLWPHRLNDRGYGLAVVGGVQRTASRWMCVLAHGEPPKGKNSAAHNCGNPACVNPQHLRWASHAENCADRKTHGTENIGERHGKTRLTAQDVKDIRAAPPDLVTLARKYGMNKHSISKIRSGKRWGHVK